MIAVIDYGMGNIHSVNKALELEGAKTIITNKAKEIRKASKVVLPGVGAFDDAMLELKKQDIISILEEHVKNKKPILGICLGMQLLFEKSEEAIKSKGLGILRGKVQRFEQRKGLKVPHIGWNQLQKIPNPKSQIPIECPLLKNVPDNSYVYFCHSYYPDPGDKETIAATTDYGSDFASCVWQDNIYGVQFHPEKSQKTGLKIIENFVNLC